MWGDSEAFSGFDSQSILRPEGQGTLRGLDGGGSSQAEAVFSGEVAALGHPKYGWAFPKTSVCLWVVGW